MGAGALGCHCAGKAVWRREEFVGAGDSGVKGESKKFGREMPRAHWVRGDIFEMFLEGRILSKKDNEIPEKANG
jgi:hypothetical protein